jgi:hypothetical protein
MFLATGVSSAGETYAPEEIAFVCILQKHVINYKDANITQFSQKGLHLPDRSGAAVPIAGARSIMSKPKAHKISVPDRHAISPSGTYTHIQLLQDGASTFASKGDRSLNLKSRAISEQNTPMAQNDHVETDGEHVKSDDTHLKSSSPSSKEVSSSTSAAGKKIVPPRVNQARSPSRPFNKAIMPVRHKDILDEILERLGFTSERHCRDKRSVREIPVH